MEVQKNRLECRNIAVERGGRRLFSGFSCQIESGSLLVLQGRNGSGKSSLLKVLACIVPTEEGGVYYNDAAAGAQEAYRSELLYLGHDLALYPALSVERNVMFWAELHGVPELADVAMHYFELEQYRYTVCRQLSAGWQKRVALSRLITVPRRYWLLDEPTTNLDAEGIALFEALVNSRVEQEGIVVLATHQPVHHDGVNIININEIN